VAGLEQFEHVDRLAGLQALIALIVGVESTGSNDAAA
jgi:hypothetical protein